VLTILSLEPVWRGLLILALGGLLFPVTGVFIVRLNLLPVRFMMMHSVMLGGALALALSFDTFITVSAVNLLFVFLLVSSSRRSGIALGRLSMFFMIFSVAAAGILVDRFHIPSKDTMSILWGSPFAATWTDAAVLLGIGLFIIAYQKIFSSRITALFFDADIAWTSGVNEKAHTYAIVCIIALSVAGAIRLMGAFLMDGLILIPAILASAQSKSVRGMFIRASVYGFSFSLAGSLASIALDIPVSAGIAFLSAIWFCLVFIVRRRK
jgi:zinc transport system permease protein